MRFFSFLLTRKACPKAGRKAGRKAGLKACRKADPKDVPKAPPFFPAGSNYLIPSAGALLDGSSPCHMFSSGVKYAVHPVGKPCGRNARPAFAGTPDASDALAVSLNQFPWGAGAKPLVRELEAKNLVDDKQKIKGTDYFVIDLLKFLATRDPPGDNGIPILKKMLPLLKHLQKQDFLVPECFVKRNSAKVYLCCNKKKDKK